MTFLIFLQGGIVVYCLLGAAAVYVTESGELPDTAAGHYILSGVYFMMCSSLLLSAVGAVSGAILWVAGFTLGSRLRTLITLGMGIVSGFIWYYLLNCGL